MVSIKTCLLVLCCLLSLYRSSQTSTLTEYPGLYPIVSYNLSYDFAYEYSSSQDSPKITPGNITLVPSPLLIEELTKMNYTDLLQAICLKIGGDLRKLSHEVQNASMQFLVSSYESGKMIVINLPRRAIEIIASTIWRVFLWSLKTILIMVRMTMIPCLMITFVALSCKFIAFMINWTYGHLYRVLVLFCRINWAIIELVSYITSRMMKILGVIKISREEKAINGFHSYNIPMAPPSKCIVPLKDSEKIIGWASCIKLYNGNTALLTAKHAWDVTTRVESVRTGNSIPKTQFTVAVESGDTLILYGPKNWEGLLGLKAVNFVTTETLAECSASIFVIKGNEWQCQPAQLVGTDGVLVTVLSDTRPGYSGTPYMNGKTILGVHHGASRDLNANYMSPIPPVSGITVPDYQFETTAPKGKLFSSSIQKKIAKQVKTPLYKSPFRKTWGDDDSDDDMSFTDAPPVFFETEVCGTKVSVPESLAPKLGEYADYLSTLRDVSLPKVEPPKVEPLVFKSEASGAEMRKKWVRPSQQKPKVEFTPPTMPFSIGEASTSQPGNAVGSSVCQNKTETNLPALHTQAAGKDSTSGKEEDMVAKVVKELIGKINVTSIEQAVVSELVQKAMKKPKQTRRKRRSKSPNTSQTNTSGTYQPPHVRSPGSVKAEKLPPRTTPGKQNVVNGANKSAPATQSWRKKSADLGGQSSAPKQNSGH